MFDVVPVDFTRMNGAPAYVGVLSEVWWRSGWVTPYTMSQLCFDNARACMDTQKAETMAFLLSKGSLMNWPLQVVSNHMHYVS